MSDSLRIFIPLYTTYVIFALSIFLFFIPFQEKQLTNEKKETILQLTDSVLSLLADYEARIQKGEITPGYARREAINQVRHLRYGREGKDYFWINDMHPKMIMHPYRHDLDGKDLTQYRDKKGNRLFVDMVETVKKNQGGYVNYYWQWKDTPEKIVPKISYVKGFEPWGWVIGTGIYVEDIQNEIKLSTVRFAQIFTGILIFIIFLSLYITKQIIQIGKSRDSAERAKRFEELRLKKLFELSQMTQKSVRDLTEFALEEAISLTESEIGYLAFLNEDETRLTMHTWSRQTMKQCEIEDKILIYNVKDTGLWAEAARERSTVIINDYEKYQSPSKKGYPEGHVPITRVINVPIFDGEKMVALSGVGNKKSDYNESDKRQLKLMMDGMLKILHRKRAEDELRESEKRYRLLADNASDGIWTVQLSDLKFSYVSPSMELITGYLTEEFANLDMGAHMTEKSRKEVGHIIAEELNRDLDEGVDKDRYRILEIEMYKKDHTRIWAEVTARFLRDKNGKPERILGITRDVTQRKALEKDLRQSNTDLRLAQQMAGIGNWSIDPATDVRVWSEEVFRIYERDPADGPCSWEDLRGMYKGKWWTQYREAMHSGLDHGIPSDMELKLIPASGKIKWVHIICEAEPEKSEKGYFIRGTIQDITERKNLEIRVQQAQKMEALGTLAGGIAHDFNNILSSIIGFTELSKLIAENNKELESNLDQVLAAGLRARDLVKHILTFSRKADTQKVNMEIIPLIKECLQFIKASVPPNIKIKRHFITNECHVHADPTQLHQVFMNLFTNAAYAMKESGGILDVSLKSVEILEEDILHSKEIEPGKYVRISVSDTGSGISPQLVEKVFEPFFTTKKRGEGTGMGLALVYGIVKEMGGSISVYSEPGTGTTFRLLLPEFVPASEKREGLENRQLTKGSGRILLVDDEPSIVEWTSLMLQQAGYEIIGFTSALEALKEFEKNPSGFDMLLTDLAMPELGGLELSSKIKEKRPDIPILLCTGFSEGLTRESISKYGINEMIMKPIIASELARAVGEAMKNAAETASE